MRHTAHCLTIAAGLGIITSCTAQPRDILEYPESKTYLVCLKREAYKAYRLPGGPLELGIVGFSACNSEFQRLIDTVAATDGRPYATALERRLRVSGPEMVARNINDLRRG